ncbi:MAG: ribose-phosphate pyrophosphokinase [Cytophagales bacterium]|nr:ribose-phosphate pyrophosphokinase [Cytophagales bacterium]
MLSSVKLFAGTASRELGERISLAYGQSLGNLTIEKFSDGEICPIFHESVRGVQLYLIQSTFPPADNLMELLLMIDAARRASAHHVTVVIPYYGYARQDRKDKPRVPIAAKLNANLLSAAGVDRLITCDLHAGQIQGFFDFPVDHLDSSTVFIPYIKSLKLENLVFAAPDVGSVSRARSYAKHFEVAMVICDKHRKKANEIASIQIIGEVKDANVVLVDDMIDTGGTLCRAVEMLKEKGARSVRAVCTHPLLSGNAYEKINASVVEEVVVTDTIPLKEETTKIKVLSIAELFAAAIKNVHERESISSLFII